MGLRVAVHGQGRPIVMIHGVGANHHVWSAVRKRLGDRYRTIAPDIPGFGKSEPVGPGFDLGQVADAVWAGIEEHLDGPADLLGNSLGGAVATEMAVRRPEYVRNLVLAAPAGFNPVPVARARLISRLAEPALTLRRIAGRGMVGSDLARRLMLAGAVHDGVKVEPGIARAMIEAPARAQRLSEAVFTAATAELGERLAQVQAPVGVIWGRHDRVVPIRALTRLSAARPDARIEIIEDAAHVAQVETPDAYVAALERLLAPVTES